MDPNVGMYKVVDLSWFMIIGGITVLFLSIVLHHQPVPGIAAITLHWEPCTWKAIYKQTRSNVETMSSAKLCFYRFDQIAWLFMALLLGFFCYF